MTTVDPSGKTLHPGDHVRVIGTPRELRSVNLHTHSCLSDRVEEVRPHKDPRGTTDVKITCGYVVPISMIRLQKCPHIAPVPAVHAFIDLKVVCGLKMTHSTRFSAREDHWTCKKCIRKLATKKVPVAKWKLCKGCDQPMLPRGQKKKPGEFDHARGCPLDKRRAR